MIVEQEANKVFSMSKFFSAGRIDNMVMVQLLLEELGIFLQVACITN